MGSSASSSHASASAQLINTTPSSPPCHPASPAPSTRQRRAPSHSTTSEVSIDSRGMEQVVVRTGRARMNVVDLHSVCGYTTHGVPAFSNGTSNTWTNSKSYLDGVFMGYRWQCVEFARRWLWTTQRLLLPERNCAYCFASCKYVYRMKNDPADPRRQAAQQGGASSSAEDAAVVTSTTTTTTTTVFPPLRGSPSTYTTTSAAAFNTTTTTSPSDAGAATPAEVLGPRKDAESWEKVPAVFVKQGSTVPPVANSLIIYPMSWGSPWGHIGVITEVDLERGLVYVADQNRYFHDWGHRAYSAVFPLEVNKGRYYIRDHESECKGWLTFPTFVDGH